MPRRPDNLETLHLCLELLKRIPRQRKIDSRELQFSSVRLKSEQIQLVSAGRYFCCAGAGLQGA